MTMPNGPSGRAPENGATTRPRRSTTSPHVERLVDRAHRPEAGALRDGELDPHVIGQHVRVDRTEGDRVAQDMAAGDLRAVDEPGS